MSIKKTKKNYLYTIILSLLITALFFALAKVDLFNNQEMKTLDARFHYSTHNIKANPQVVVLLIDEASLQSMEPLVGRWPWPRSLYGELVDFLASQGAKGVLFDILFTEPQIPRNTKGELGESDQAMVMSSASSGITHHAFQIVTDIEDEVNKGLLNQNLPQHFIDTFSMQNIEAKNFTSPTFNNYYLPFKEIHENTFSMGVVEFSPDSDGIYRSTHLLRPYHGSFYPVLSMSYWLREKEFKKIEISDNSFKIWRKETAQELTLPLFNGRYLINMKKEIVNYSIGGVFSTIQKIMKGESENLIVNPEDFKDKIVIVGASAVGVEDLKLTSTGNNVPGVYLHASTIANFLDRDFIKQFSPSVIFLLFAFVNVAIGLLILFSPTIIPSISIYILALITHLSIAFILFDHYRLWILIFAPLVSLTLNFFVLFIVKSFTEGKEKKFLKAAFGNYISPELIDMMYQSGEAPKLGGDAGIRTAFFTDIQGFSTFSEKLSATKLVELLNEYLTVMTDILIEEQGTLDKYEGDAIIAFFGAPMPLPDHAQRAVRVSLKMQAALAELRLKWTSEGDKWPVIVHNMRMRIGINTGEIVTGNMGSKMRMNYTMMGDSVNLAARLEESAKQYGIFIQIAHFTYEMIKEDFLCREVDTIRVVGKSEPITTYEPVGSRDKTEPLLVKMVELFHSGLTLYKNQSWDEAQAFFEQSLVLELERFPELKQKTNPSKIYITRCQQFKSEPPPQNWDGVYNLTEK
ncbi:MAG: CHASE2 domain-containing protein [Bacteriovoracaceae bacterium]